MAITLNFQVRPWKLRQPRRRENHRQPDRQKPGQTMGPPMEAMGQKLGAVGQTTQQ